MKRKLIRGIIWDVESFIARNPGECPTEYTVLRIHQIYESRDVEFLFYDYIPLINKSTLVGRCVDITEETRGFLLNKRVTQHIAMASHYDSERDYILSISKPNFLTRQAREHYLRFQNL